MPLLSFLLVILAYRFMVHTCLNMLKLRSFFQWQCGVDANVRDRVLLQSLKPSLHTNVDCNALVAAVVHRQVPVVGLLLQVNFSLVPFNIIFTVWFNS